VNHTVGDVRSLVDYNAPVQNAFHQLPSVLEPFEQFIKMNFPGKHNRGVGEANARNNLVGGHAQDKVGRRNCVVPNALNDQSVALADGGVRPRLLSGRHMPVGLKQSRRKGHGKNNKL